MANVKDLLGTFSTSLTSSNANRIKNVNSASNYIDGTVLYPGEEFSTHDVIAPFTAERGYAEAANYVNGEIVDGMGGGVCQVSTTLYNAVLRAELEVTERAPHSMTVSYVKLSEDAAIAGTWKDLKFRNSSQYPIYIEGSPRRTKRSYLTYTEKKPGTATARSLLRALSLANPEAIPCWWQMPASPLAINLLPEGKRERQRNYTKSLPLTECRWSAQESIRVHIREASAR